MRTCHRKPERIISIDPMPRGFGFVVLEGPRRLVDWGVREVRDHSVERTLTKIRSLIDLYHPAVLATEETSDRSSRRGPRVVQLIEEVVTLGAAMGLRVHAVTPWRVQGFFAAHGARTKYAIDLTLCDWFPELKLRRPPVRKPWMSEDERQAIFDAAAFAVTSLKDQ